MSIAKKRSNNKWIHAIISVVMIFGFGFLPPVAPLTPLGMRLLGIFLGVVYAYSTCEIIWPSLLGIVAFGLSGFYPSLAAGIGKMMGSSLVFQIITQYFTTGAIVYYGVSKWIVAKTLSRKIFKGRPLFYTWCFMVTSMWLCLVLETIPMFLLLYGIWNDIADNCNYKKDDMFRYYGFGAILIALIMGVSMVPYQSWQLGLATSWANVTGSKINLGVMLLCTAIIGMSVLSAYIFLGAKLFKIDFAPMAEYDMEKLGADNVKLRPRAKRIILVYLITVSLALFSSTFPNNVVAQFIDGKLTLAGLFCLCTALLLVLPGGEGDGKPAIVFNEVKKSDAVVSWPVIFMCALTIPLATAMTSEETGILQMMDTLFSPVLAGRSPVFIMIVTILVVMVLTNMTSNIAVGNAMIPIISPFVLAQDVNPMLFGCALVYTANIGIFLPGASAPASIFHGRNEIPDAKKRTKVLSFALLLYTVMTCLVFSVAQTISG